MPRFLFFVVVGSLTWNLRAADDPARPFGTASPVAPAGKKPAAPDAAGKSKTETSDATLGLTGEDLGLFRLHWRSVAVQYAQIGESFYCAPKYEARYLNSTHTDPDAWQRANSTSERVVTGGSMVRDVVNAPAREEALVATAMLPGLIPGQYGHIHSATVAEVVSPEEMLITDLWLVDAQDIANQKKDEFLTGERLFKMTVEDRNRQQQQQRNQNTNSGFNTTAKRQQTPSNPAITMDQLTKELESRYKQRTQAMDLQNKWKGQRVRVLGFPTAGLLPGTRWKFNGGMGPQLVFILDPASHSKSRPAAKTLAATRMTHPVYTALNGELFRQPWKEDRFARLLAERDLDGPQFVAMLRDQFKASAADAKAGVVAAMEEARAKKLAAELNAKAEEEARQAAAEKAAKNAAKSGKTPATPSGGGEKPLTSYEQKYGRKLDGAPVDKPAAGEKKPSAYELKYGKKLDGTPLPKTEPEKK